MPKTRSKPAITTKKSPVKPVPDVGRGSHTDLWIAVVLLIATFAVYAPVRSFDFVNYDDPEYVTRNPHVRAGLTGHGLAWAFTSTQAANWFPVTWLSHMLDCQLFGLNAGRQHLTNLVLHACAAFLLFVFLRRATSARWPAAFVALVFALHPLHVESVSWIAERKDVLSACFWFLALWLYVRYAEAPSRERYLLVVAGFCMGFLAKPMIVTLPFALLLLDVWPLRRISPVRRAVLEKAPLFAIAAIGSLVTYIVQQGGGAVKTIPFALRFENALVSWLVYIAKTFWPARLAVFYAYPLAIPVWEAVFAGIVLAAISAIVLRYWSALPYLAVGWFWYLGTLVPVIGLVQVGEQARADRYTYVPMVGLTIMLAWGAMDLLRRRQRFKPAVMVAGAVACVCCAGAAGAQVRYWRNSETLFQHALKVTGPNYVAEHMLGDYLLTFPARAPEAIAHLESAVRLRPDSAEAHTDLASAYATVPARLPEAVAEYQAALRIAPDAAIPHNDLGNALALLPGHLPDAVSEYKTALRLKPDYAEAHNNLGSAFAKMARTPEAIEQFQAALKIDPDYEQARKNLNLALSLDTSIPDSAEAHYEQGIGLSKAGRRQEAITQFEAALRMKPGYAEAHNNLGVTLSQMPGRSTDAIAQFQAALRIDPEYVDAHVNLGIALANAGRIAEAVKHLEAAQRIKPDPEVQRTLEQLKR